MEIDESFALFVTWTCYGTWLPGDERGYVSNTLLPKGGFIPKQNVPGEPITKDHAYTKEQAKKLLKHDPVYLTSAQALVVAQSLVDAARTRNWRILRAAIMANHVHALVMDCPDDGPAVRRVLKGNTQAALIKHRGKPQRWWTSGGSDRYKHGTDAIEASIRYVANQERKLAEIVDMEVRECFNE